MDGSTLAAKLIEIEHKVQTAWWTLRVKRSTRRLEEAVDEHNRLTQEILRSVRELGL